MPQLKKRLCIRINDKALARIRVLAKERGVTMSTLVLLALDEFLRRNKP